MGKIYQVGKATVEVIEKGTITRFPDGNEVVAWTETGEKYDEQVANAQALGYGDDVDAMNRDHDLCHNLLAQALGDDFCPVLYGVATHNYVSKELYREREAIVFLMQKLMRAGLEETADYVDKHSRTMLGYDHEESATQQADVSTVRWEDDGGVPPRSV